MSVLAEQLFDLSTFEHKDLFSPQRAVWETLNSIERYILSKSLGQIKSFIPEGVYLLNPETIFIDEGCTIEPTAYICGPCYIGKNCQIRHAAYLRGNIVVGDHCVIGHCSEIKNSVFLNRAQAAHFAYVGDSLLGNRVNLGAGTRCANLRLDQASVSARFEGQRYATNLRKLGAIIGDDSQIGCNCVGNPGALLPKKTQIYPGTVFYASSPEHVNSLE